ncbi:dynamin family protein [Streptomyces sp. DSM 44917]|uniref:Dynamin family protein n=1 Tax=Streptomyces boetiae TaxID=3075541 RepID=A0ABU2L9K7_9ACTN|nr:dynamin family protein [Streptomyces sp. DSM 44917]MDT0308017.1 dynamin family protein [Streptomyces sp. DSM 44917]
MDAERVRRAFGRADAQLASQEAGQEAAPGGGEGPRAEARRLLREIAERFDARLRLALVGRVSSGKSTLANALLGAGRAPTGALELTFNVTWFRHAETPSLTLHLTDGSPPQRHDPAALERFAVRAREQDPALRELLRRVDHLEIGEPSPALRDYDLADTPGLDSVHGEDSANALRWLGRPPEHVREGTVAHAGRADALIAVFDRGLSHGFAELLRDFAGAGLGAAGPVTTVGALTKVEQYWHATGADPLAEGRRVAESLMEAADARRLLYDIRPVVGLLGAAAATFTEEEHADLTELTKLDSEELRAHVRRVPFFAHRELPGVPLPPARRAALLERFGAYGVWLACELIRQDLTDTAGLRAELLRRSGVEDLRRLLLDHFGNRASLIKLDRAIRETRVLADRLGDAVAPAAAGILRLEFSEHAFRELAVLRDHYAGRLALTPPEVRELLRVTGESGATPAARLGLPEDAPPEALAGRAREGLERWALAAALGEHSGPTRTAAGVIRRSYELLLHELRRGAA